MINKSSEKVKDRQKMLLLKKQIATANMNLLKSGLGMS